MDPITAKLMSAAGGAAAEERIYVDDLFGIQLRTGSGTSASSTAAVVNGLDLSGEGGIVWVKERNSNNSHTLFSSDIPEVSGKRPYLTTNESHTAATSSNIDINFNSNGYTIEGNDGRINQNAGNTYVDWAFRKCPGFFDVVTWTGDGTNNRAISHNLGHNIRALFIKSSSNSGDWAGAYLQGASLWTGESYTGMYLNKTEIRGGTTSDGLGVSAISTTTFTVNASGSSTTFEFVPNANGVTYVAYLFSDQAAFGDDSDEKILEVGTYSGTGSAGKEIDLGFEAQWVMVKRATGGTGNWEIADIMRGQPALTGSTDGNFLRANSDVAEFTNYPIHPNPTGFTIQNFGGGTNASGSSYWYMAIRRPNKPQTDADDVFEIDPYSGSTTTAFQADFPPDLAFIKNKDASSNWFWVDRFRGNNALRSNNTNSEGAASAYDVQFRGAFTSSWTNYVGYMFRRAPEFFDIVAFKGDGTSNRQLTHNLGAVPQIAILKNRTDSSSNWLVHHPLAGASSNGMQLNSTNANTGSGIYSANPTSTTVQLGNVTSTAYGQNISGKHYILYLFASLSGVSKCGSYNGSSSAVDVDCGFTNGARFVMIKRTDSAGNWTIFDTERGIVSGNDPYLRFNSMDAQNNSFDAIDPLASGFTVNSGNGNYNTSGGTYIFLAIA